MATLKKAASLALAVWCALGLATTALAGPDDDAPFLSDLSARNSIDPIQDPNGLADFPTNVDPSTGLRIMPPTETTLFTGQKLDLRVETQFPSADDPHAYPELVSLKVNGRDVTDEFEHKVAEQGGGAESGTPISPRLFGATVRNLNFSKPGTYYVEAQVRVDGHDSYVSNVYRVARMKKDNGDLNRIVFYLGDALGQPIRTAARIYSKGVFEGRAQGRLNYDESDNIGLVATASFDSIITDSAPGMANYITGMKQPNNALNVSADNTPENGLDNPRIETLMEYLKREHDWKIGVVSDAYITDATPGSSVAHVRSRGARDTIAQQFIGFYQDGTAQPSTGYASLQELAQPLDVIIGAGARYWVGNETDADGNGVSDLDEFWQEGSSGRSASELDLYFDVAPSLGYQTARTKAELDAADPSQPILAIFGGDGRAQQNALDDRNVPPALDRLVARGMATIGGRDASSAEIGLQQTPKGGTACGATVQACFNDIPSKPEMVDYAIRSLERMSRGKGWFLLVEQSHIDKLAHPLEIERTIYEAIEMDNALGLTRDYFGYSDDSLIIVTADHAQPESIIGVALPGAITAGGPTAPGGCFSGSSYPLTLGDGASPSEPCALQNVIGTFNDGTFPTYNDANGDNFPDDPDAAVKLIVEQAGRPTYSTDFLTNPVPLFPGAGPALPNPQRDPNGLLQTGNMPARAQVGSAAKNGGVSVAPHSTDDVPLLSYGETAGVFGGFMENSDVSIRIAAALSGKRRARNLLPERTPNGRALEFGDDDDRGRGRDRDDDYDDDDDDDED
ncbi:MAG: alkaline phosphatase [Pseudomonadota bacterium]